MNYLGHHEIACQLSENPDNYSYKFGSMIPDFTGMFRVHKTYEKVNDQALLDGIRLHNATDAVFDDIDLVKQLGRDMRGAFKKFMPRWPAAQSANVGKDILFDSYFLIERAPSDSYYKTMAMAGRLTVNQADIAEPSWHWLDRLNSLTKHGIPDYGDPEVVAFCIHRRLVGTRTNFGPEYLPELASSIVDYQERVMDIGKLVTDETLSKLRTGLVT